MKKKWLIGLISALMAVTLCFGFAACGGDKGGDDDKTTLKAVLDNLRSQYNDTTNTPKDYTLTTSVSIAGKQYAVSWTAEAVTEGITLSDYVVIGEPDTATKTVLVDITATTTDINYKITASATVGKESGNVTFERTIPATIVGDVNIDFADYELGDAVKLGDAFNTASLEEAIKSIVDVPADFGAVTKVSNVYAGNSANNGGPSDYRLKDGFLKTGTGDYNGEIELTFNKFIEKVEIIAIGWSSSDKITINDGTETTLSGTDFTTVSYTVENAATAKVTNVSIVTKKRTLIFKIAVTFVEGAQRLEYTYEYNESGKAWTHKKTEVNNRVDEVAEEPCTPVNNVCKYCEHEFPQEEIVTELFKLGSGESLSGTYELTGYVTNVVELPSAQYNNATVWMLVGDKEIEAYHCTAADDALYAKLAIGATVTVQGSLTNFSGTHEFTTGCSFTDVKDEISTLSEDIRGAVAEKALAYYETEYDTATTTSIQLPASYCGVTLTWSVDTNTCFTIENNKLTVVLPEMNAADVTASVHVTLDLAEDRTVDLTFTAIAPVDFEGEGTESKPYTVDDILKGYRRLEGQEKPGIYVTGYVVAVGELNSSYGLKNVKIAASAAESNSAKQLLIFNVNWGDAMPKGDGTNLLRVGDEVLVFGGVTTYNNAPQIHKYNNNKYATFKKWVRNYTADERVENGLASLNLSKVKFYRANEEITLPATDAEYGTTFAWTVKDGTNEDYVSIEGGVLKIVKLPAAQGTEVKLTLVATASYTGATTGNNTKEFELTIRNPAEGEEITWVTLSFENAVNSKDDAVGGYTDTWGATRGGHAFSIENFNNNASNTRWEHIRTGRNGVACTGAIVTDCIEEIITKITFSLDSGSGSLDKCTVKLYVSSTNNFSGTGVKTYELGADLSKTAVNTISIPTDGQGANQYYRLEFACDNSVSSNGFIRVTSVNYIGTLSAAPAAASIAYSAPVADLPHKD